MLHLTAAGSIHFRTVAFRYTETVIDVVTLHPNLNVEDLNAERRQRADE